MIVPDIYVTGKLINKTNRKITDKVVSNIISDVTSIYWETRLDVMSSNDAFTEFHNNVTNSCQRLRAAFKKTLLPDCTAIE